MLKIRSSYLPNEICRLYEIEKACFTRKFRWNKEDFLEELKKADVLVADYDNKLVGFIFGEVDKEGGHIVTVDVDPEFRNKGIGAALVEQLETNYKERGIKHMLLEVHVDNPAQLLYFKLGYRVVGVKPNYYANDSMAISMGKKLKK